MNEPSPLTPQEHKVLRLLAEGFTPAEIATRLVVSPGTISRYCYQIRQKLGARTMEQAMMKVAWYHPKVLSGCMVKHGTLKSLAWHDEQGVPLCEPCEAIVKARERKVKVPRLPSKRPPGTPNRRLTPLEQHAKRGQPVDHGTIQMARRHIARGHRIRDLTCGCREAYRQWYREYDRQRGELDAA